MTPNTPRLKIVVDGVNKSAYKYEYGVNAVNRIGRFTMEKPVIGARVEPELKSKIETEAGRLDRPASWLIEKLLKLGWEKYQRSEAKRQAA
jgi:hypothetical protein